MTASWPVAREGAFIVVTEPDGTRVEADVAELALIHVTVNDQGGSVWWVMEDAGEIILGAFPRGAAGEDEVIGWMMALPGFAHQAMVDAMGSARNADFVVWRR